MGIEEATTVLAQELVAGERIVRTEKSVEAAPLVQGIPAAVWAALTQVELLAFFRQWRDRVLVTLQQLLCDPWIEELEVHGITLVQGLWRVQ